MPPMSSSWKPTAFLVRKPLTDRQIERYRKRGYYSAAFRQARRELMERQRNKKMGKREGNFVEVDGRFVYSPE